MMSDWISVKDELPEFEQVVDVWVIWRGRDLDVHGERLTDVEYYPEMEFPWNHEEINGYFDKVSHWMPLPNPPEVSDE